MKNINKGQRGPDIYRIRKLPKKTCTRTGRRNRDPYTTDKKGTKMAMGVTRGESIPTDQGTSIAVATNTTFQPQPSTNYENRRFGSHNRSRIISKERTINVHVKKDDSSGTELRNHRKGNANHCVENQTVKEILRRNQENCNDHNRS